jgi:hypothetical protein
MKAQNHTSEKNTVLITESSKNIEEILCKSLFNDFTTQVAREKEAIIDICKEHETIILSSACLESCTYIYKHYLETKCSLHLLNHIDINEDGLDNDSIFRFTLFNLELFSKKSFRAKATYIANNIFNDVSKDKYKEIFDLELMEQAPLLYINLYRVIAFENQTALIHIFDLLRNLEKDTISAFLNSFLPFIFYANSSESFCNSLIYYYKKIDYSKNEDKLFLFLFLNKIYGKMDAPTIQKISASLVPIISYCICEDDIGENIDLLDFYIKSLPSLTKNTLIVLIVIYSKIFRNLLYLKAFSPRITEPSNKCEHYYNETLLKVENLLEKKEISSKPGLQLKKGVDQYIGYLQDNNIPEEPTHMFDLLLKQS